MEHIDHIHLKVAIEHFTLYLLNGLIATEKDFTTTPEFVDKVVEILSKANEELFSLSPEMKEKMSFIHWDFVEKMRNPDELRNAIQNNPHQMYLQIRKEVPEILRCLKDTLKEEK